jgi:hypothetical protein
LAGAVVGGATAGGFAVCVVGAAGVPGLGNGCGVCAAAVSPASIHAAAMTWERMAEL